MKITPPFNFKKWIEENRHLLKPPVGNKCLWEDGDFMVFVVGGPNARTDFHINQGPEFFHQLEGDMVLKIRENNKTRDIEIKAGDVFLLPGGVPHAPQRPASTVGLVLEQKRRPGELDGFAWYCPKCDRELYRTEEHIIDIVKQLPPIFDRFYNDPKHCTCGSCGTVVERPVRK